MRGRWMLAAVLAGGCTFGLGEQARFVTRNLEVTGTLEDGAFVSEEGTVEVVPRALDLAEGVVIFVDAQSEARTVQTELSFEGDLGALCPGARVDLRRTGSVLVAENVSGAPPEMMTALSDLVLTIRTRAIGTNVEELDPETVTLTSATSTDGFAVMAFTSTTMIDGAPRTVTGTFEIARVVEDVEVPGWEGDTWEGMPIGSWD